MGKRRASGKRTPKHMRRAKHPDEVYGFKWWRPFSRLMNVPKRMRRSKP